MAGSVRESESLWNTQEETLPVEMSGKNLWQGKERHSSFRRGSSPKWSNSEANNELKSSDFSQRPSWEPLQANSNEPSGDGIGRDRRRMHTEPALDGWDRQYNGHPSDDSFSLPHRGRGRGSIRSTSRDRDQSRSRSRSRGRSRSPNRSRDKDRGMVRSRSRSRDRDRDRDRDKDRGRGGGSARERSRSPFSADRRESYDYIDPRSGSRMSSQPCRTFAAGNCMRGSQCRFSHQENLNSMKFRRSENDITERWNSRPQNSGASRYGNDRNSADRPRNKVSDGYKKYIGADEQARDTSKDTFLCKDFQRGRCHKGASCRFPHNVASGDNYDRGNRNTYDDQDRKRQPNRNGKFPCKYFAMGKCSRDDCKFSHDGPTSGGFDGRSRNNSSGNNLDDKNKTWNGPSWDEGDASGFSDIVKSNHSFDDKNKSWNGPSWDDSNASGVSDVAKSKHNIDDKNKSWNGPSWDDSSASGFSDVAKSKHNLDDKNKSWNGPSWDDASAQGFSDIAKSNDKLDGKNKPWNGLSWDDSSASSFSDVAKSTGWDGSSVGNMKFRDSARADKQSNSKSRQWDAPGWNEKASERNDNLNVTNDADMAANVLGVAHKEEPQRIPDGSQSQTLDGISLHAHQQHIKPKASGYQLGTTAMRPEVSEISSVQQRMKQGGDNFAMIDDSNLLDVDMVSENADNEVLTLGKDFIESGYNMGFQRPSSLGGNYTLSLNPSNGPKTELNGSVQGAVLPLHSLTQLKSHHKETVEELEMEVPRVMPVMNETVVSREQVAQISSLPASLTQISQTGQFPQAYAELNLANVMGLINSLPSSSSSVLHIDPTLAQSNPDNRSKEQYDIARDIEASKPGNNGVSMGFLSSSTGQANQMPIEQLSPVSTTVDPNSNKLQTSGISEEGYKKSLKIKRQEPVNPEVNENSIAEKHKHGQENIHPGGSDAQAKVEEGNISNDEKAMRQFKIALVEFVKEILKPTWKEGRMSREVHKTIVKKVVDKVSSTIQGIQIPRTQEKIDQYLAFSKSKIAKLVEAYVERFLKG